jgi:hypothetical protein
MAHWSKFRRGARPVPTAKRRPSPLSVSQLSSPGVFTENFWSLSIYGASSLCWPRLHFDLPSQILRFRPKVRPYQISTTNPVEKCNKIRIYAKRGPFWGGIRMCCTLWPSTSLPHEGVLEYPWSTESLRDTHSLRQGKHMGGNANWRSPQCDSGSAIWSLTPPTRSDLRTSQHRRQRGPQTRITFNESFSPQLISVCRRPRCRKREKWQGMRLSILAIYRTETTRRADFAVHLIRRDRRAPVICPCMRSAHHLRSSTFAVVSDRQLRLRAKSKRNTTVVSSRLCADGRGIQNL